MSGWLRGPKSPRAKRILRLEAPALVKQKHVAPFTLNRISENPSLIDISVSENGILPDISGSPGVLTAESKIRVIRFIDEIDRWYVQNKGDEAVVMVKIRARLKGDRSEAWLKSLTTYRSTPLTVNKIRQRLLKDFRVEKWKELMELRYGEGASHEDGQSYLSVADGGRMPEYFLGSEFKLKLDYMEDIEKFREQVKSKNSEIKLLESIIEGKEEARKAAELKTETQLEMSSEALARVSEIVINSVSGMEDKKLGELEKRRAEEDNRYRIMADYVITMGEEVTKLRDIVQKLQKEGSSGTPTAVNSPVATPRKLPRVIPNSPYIAGSIACPIPLKPTKKDIAMNLLDERNEYAKEKALKAHLTRFRGGGPIHLAKEDSVSSEDTSLPIQSASSNVSPPLATRELETEIGELLREADEGGDRGLLGGGLGGDEGSEKFLLKHNFKVGNEWRGGSVRSMAMIPLISFVRGPIAPHIYSVL
ncbi:hypothetical protein C7212DRAFT_309484 [Tuber magnatum]|uniref:Uncharacterized protein n=1 Tax=Tuber magnatum TaxID=42249 RepID=A0A317T0N4_9PEZI|nr:hypothetical protein C7212DRAFT_309484 [Tuber magnatum]